MQEQSNITRRRLLVSKSFSTAVLQNWISNSGAQKPWESLCVNPWACWEESPRTTLQRGLAFLGRPRRTVSLPGWLAAARADRDSLGGRRDHKGSADQSGDPAVGQ